jgi:hypothetical protein
MPQSGDQYKGCAMNVVKQIAMGSGGTSSEMKATGNVQELARAGGASRPSESDDDSVGSFNSLLRRISEVSTSEIENLIGELQKLRRKLQTDGSRVQSAIAEYAELNQQVMQLTKIISDSVKKLPNTAGVGA